MKPDARISCRSEFTPVSAQAAQPIMRTAMRIFRMVIAPVAGLAAADCEGLLGRNASEPVHQPLFAPVPAASRRTFSADTRPGWLGHPAAGVACLRQLHSQPDRPAYALSRWLRFQVG